MGWRIPVFHCFAGCVIPCRADRKKAGQEDWFYPVILSGFSSPPMRITKHKVPVSETAAKMGQDFGISKSCLSATFFPVFFGKKQIPLFRFSARRFRTLEFSYVRISVQLLEPDGSHFGHFGNLAADGHFHPLF